MSAITPQERAVLDLLAEAWNAFVQLPVEHGDDTATFRHGVHALQSQMLMRSARRDLAVTIPPPPAPPPLRETRGWRR